MRAKVKESICFNAGQKLAFINESNLIEGISETSCSSPYIVDHLEALENALRVDFEFTGHDIRQLHEILMRRVMKEDLQDQIGKWRECEVTVGEDRGAPAWLIPRLMQYWCEWGKIHHDSEAWKRHLDFEAIHPFADGNGRVGRILWVVDWLRYGRGPSLISASKRVEYYREIQMWRANKWSSNGSNYEDIITGIL